MAEGGKKMEPWQLILILILVLAFFGGLYLVNQTISSQLDTIENAIDVKTQTLKSSIDNINQRLDNMRAMHAASKAAAPAPAAEPAEAEAAAEGEPKPAGDEAKPAAEEAPAEPAKKE